MLGKFKYMPDQQLMLILPARVIDAKEQIFYARFVEFAMRAGQVRPGFVEIMYMDDVESIDMPLRSSLVAMQVLRHMHEHCRPRGTVFVCSNYRSREIGEVYRQMLSVLDYPMELVQSTGELPVYLRKWTAEDTDTRALTGILTQECESLRNGLPQHSNLIEAIEAATDEMTILNRL